MPAKLGEYTYSAQRMAGTPTLTATLNYPVCLDDEWTGEEFVEFRGERYYVGQVPTSSKDNKSITYKHELQFVSERIVLENVYFMDVVTEGADTYHSNSTSVKFMGDIKEFVGRLNASMTKSGIGYSVIIDRGITSEVKLVSLENVYIAEALQSIYTIYDLPYYFVGKVCHIGYTENVITTPFEYRKGLISIKKTNANYKIVNRVTGVGSSDNIPFYYPNDDETGTVERCQNLMPSIYRETGGAERFYNALNNTYKIPGTDDYYSFKNTYSAKKVKEIKVDFSDIKPTIEGVKNASGQLFGEIAGIAFDQNDSDELGTGSGNNVFNGTDEYVHSYFYIKLHIYNGDYGFNLFEQGLEGGTAVINMTTGNCAACEFEIGVTYKDDEPNRAFNPVLVDSSGNLPAGDFEKKVTSQTSQYVARQQDTSTNKVWIAVKKDNTSFGVVMPNATNNYRPAVGDKFVITGIKMPKSLVVAAEDRLEEALIKYMSENNDEKFSFSLSFSRVFLAENSDLADLLNENVRIYIKYNNKEYLMYVNSYTCKADKNCLYDISVELTDKLSANVSALRSTITEIAGDIIGDTLGNGYESDILAKTVKHYIRKNKEDTAQEKITFAKGLEIGTYEELTSGGKISAEGSGFFNELSAYGVNGIMARNGDSFVKLSIKAPLPGYPAVTGAILSMNKSDMRIAINNAYFGYLSNNGTTGENTFSIFHTRPNSTSSGAGVTLSSLGKISAKSISRNGYISLDYTDGGLGNGYDTRAYPSIRTDFGTIYFQALGRYSGGLSTASTGETRFFLNTVKTEGAPENPGRIDLKTDSLSIIRAGLSVGESDFISGLNGAGSRIDGNGNAEFNNLVVRGGITASEFIVNQIRASNGSNIISDCVFLKAAPYTYSGLNGFEWFNVIKGQELKYAYTVPFSVGDILNYRRVVSGSTGVQGVVSYYTKVTSVVRTATTHANPGVSVLHTGWLYPSLEDLLASSNPIKEFPFYGDNDTWVRVDGSTQNRKGWINLNASPYFGEAPQISAEVGLSGNGGGSVAQMGKLTLDGTNSYYGFMLKSPSASWRDSILLAYYRADNKAYSARIGNLIVRDTENIYMHADYYGSPATYGGINFQKSTYGASILVHAAQNKYVQLIYTTYNNGIWGIRCNNNGSLIFQLGSTNNIAGWNFNNSALYAGTLASVNNFATSGITLFSAGAISAKNFLIDTSGNVKLKGYIEATSGSIGGWNISNSALYAGTLASVNNFATSGITLFSAGAISAKNFLIDTSGNVKLKGYIEATSGSIGGVSISNKYIGINADDSGASGSFFADKYLGVRMGVNYFRVDANSSSLQATIYKKTDTTAALNIRNESLSSDYMLGKAIESIGSVWMYGNKAIHYISCNNDVSSVSQPYPYIELNGVSNEIYINLRTTNGKRSRGKLILSESPSFSKAVQVLFQLV